MDVTKLQWHEIKGVWVGICDDQIVCMIDKMDGMPCEAWAAQPLQSVFVTADAAKKGAEEILSHYVDTKAAKPKTFAELVVPALQSMLDTIKKDSPSPSQQSDLGGRPDTGTGVTESEALEHKIDRAGWPSGPWDSEPDRLDFIVAGFSCFVLRNLQGAWCGYVGVPESHPYFGKDYNDVDVVVHHGLTYAGKCSPPICHVPSAGLPDNVWWLGFDCHHYLDFAPGMARYDRGIYRDIRYARQQTELLAVQLAGSQTPSQDSNHGGRPEAGNQQGGVPSRQTEKHDV